MLKKKYNRMQKNIVFIGIFTLFTIAVNAVSFTASAPKEVGVGQQFQLTYTTDAMAAHDIRVPEMDNFRTLANYESRNQSVSLVNGKATATGTISYTYTLSAAKEGQFTIPAASITVGGKKISSNTVNITVKKGVAKPVQPNTVVKQQNITANNLFLRAIPSCVKLYEHDYLLLTYKLYSAVDLVSVSGQKLPAFNDFLTQETKESNTGQVSVETYNGEQYNTVILYQTVLYPQKPGVLKIGKASFDPVVRVYNEGQMQSVFDDPFQNVKKTLTTPEITLTVEKLPDGKPADFSGMVGDFTIKSSISSIKLQANEPITLKYTISGGGDMKMLPNPKINFPTEIEAYDPKVDVLYNAQGEDINSTKTLEYLVIPRKEGDFTIPAVVLNYFDTKTNSYKELRSDEYEISVSGVAESADENNNNLQSTNGKSVSKTNLTQYLPYAIALFLVILAIILFIFYKKKNKKPLDKNTVLYNQTMEQLTVAKQHLQTNDKEAFHNEMLKILWNYLSQKLSIPLATLTKENVKETLENKSVSSETITEVMNIWNQCEFARYAPTSDAQAMDELYEQMRKIITILHQKI